MNFKTQNFLPVIFGNDINVYSLARAFYEEYSIKSKVFGKSEKSTCYKSELVDFTEVRDLDTDDVFIKTVCDFAKDEHRKLLLMGCGDSYVACIARNRDKLPSNVIVPYDEYYKLEQIIDKNFFYELCERSGIDYPKTFSLTPDMVDDFSLPFDAPYAFKPANQIEYYKHKYAGQKKVFIINSFEELKKTAKEVFKAGYNDEMIVQEFIPGDDTNMRVLTSYSDKLGKVKMMCLGHVLLEEHTPYGIGNHAVIINEYNEKLINSLKALLEKLEFKGFSNFDIKYDERDGKFKVFEMNVRQGRSNFYVTGAGHNIAKLVVNDYIYHRAIEQNIAKNEHLWMVVPKRVAFKYAPAYKSKMRKLIREKKYVNPLYFKPDSGLERMVRLWRSQFRHFENYKKYPKI